MEIASVMFVSGLSPKNSHFMRVGANLTNQKVGGVFIERDRVWRSLLQRRDLPRAMGRGWPLRGARRSGQIGRQVTRVKEMMPVEYGRSFLISRCARA